MSKQLELTELSPQTIQELVTLTKHFDCGAEITINLDESELTVVGVDVLDEQGNLQIRRVYDCRFDWSKDGKCQNNSSDMIEQIKEDDKILKEANLYEHYEGSKEKVERE